MQHSQTSSTLLIANEAQLGLTLHHHYTTATTTTTVFLPFPTFILHLEDKPNLVFFLSS